jgi:hypothetical protein
MSRPATREQKAREGDGGTESNDTDTFPKPPKLKQKFAFSLNYILL